MSSLRSSLRRGAPLTAAATALLLAGCGADDPLKERADEPRQQRSAIERALESTVAITAGTGGEAKTGTGTVIAKGVVVTDRALVVDGSGRPRPSVAVRTADGREASGTVDGIDPLSGLAAIGVRELETVPSLRAGAARSALGDAVTAVAMLGGKRPAARRGEVLSTGRVARREGVAETGLLEASATLGVQSVGGALVDAQGRAVAITTRGPAALLPASVVALPVRSARRIAQALHDDGRVRRAYLGLETVEVTAARAEELGLSTHRGLIVRAAVPGSPADYAGLRMPTGVREVGGRQIPTGGDVVVAIGDTRLATPEDLEAALERSRPGQRVRLRVIRGREADEVSVRLGER